MNSSTKKSTSRSLFSEHVFTSIEINAPKEKVWKALSNLEDYSNWNPFITEANGQLKIGERLSINAGGMKFKPTITSWEEGSKLEWLGNLLISGLFDGRHSFELKEVANGNTLFIHQEHFKGFLVPIFRGMLRGKTKNGFEQMNEKLKEVVESKI